MDNRDAIIRKLNALKAKANNAGSPEEAATFMNGFNNLMQKYRLTETDLEVKNSSIEGVAKAFTKQLSQIEHVCSLIATLTDTRAIKAPNSKGVVAFIGLRVDVEYANWVFDLIHGSLDTGLNLLPLSREYHDALNSGGKPAQIKHNYTVGFLGAVILTIREMIEANKTVGNSLVLLKQAIIQTFIDNNGGSKEGGDVRLKVYTGEEQFANKGFDDGQDVKLNKGVESAVKGYLK